MNGQAIAQATPSAATPLKRALYQNRAVSKKGMLERLFAIMFDNLVYPQIWEDPVVDLKAMEVQPGQHIVAIASGGCNVMSYLTANPGRITAVDLNPAHIALNRLKQAAAQHLPSHDDFRRFFSVAQSEVNEDLYDLLLAPKLDDRTRDYWSSRGLLGRRRISMFSRGFYRHGMLGYFIGLSHLAAQVYGVKPSQIMQSASLEEQRTFFDNNLAPLFDRRLVRWVTSSPVSLYGLGIPPAQYVELAEGRHMADVLRERVETLACGHDLKSNYFARQAFGRNYRANHGTVAMPPYLEHKNWQTIRDRAERIETVNDSITTVLWSSPPRSVDRVVLLDAQDWMTDQQMNELWAAIAHAAAPSARVIFRTAAKSSPLEKRLNPDLLAAWSYDAGRSAELTQQDRSAIYGGFHLYALAE